MPEPDDLRESFFQIISGAARATPAVSDAKAKLEQDRLFGVAKRSERYKSCVHWITVIGVWLLGITIIVVLIFRFIHMILPPRDQWMTPEQVHSLDEFMFSGLVGSVLSRGVKRLQTKADDETEADS